MNNVRSESKNSENSGTKDKIEYYGTKALSGTGVNSESRGRSKEELYEAATGPVGTMVGTRVRGKEKSGLKKGIQTE